MRKITITVDDVVALRKESVDRNWQRLGTRVSGTVALRKESVDRNSIVLASFRACTTVALRKESVDRNLSSPLVAGSLISRSPQGERG